MDGRREPSPEANAVARAVVDAALEVHRRLGPGYAESVYEASLCHELGLRDVAYERQALIRVRYKDVPVGEGRMDLIVENLVVVALKACPEIAPIHTAQLISYLKASRRELGLILNFGGPYMKAGIRRILLTSSPPTVRASNHVLPDQWSSAAEHARRGSGWLR